MYIKESLLVYRLLENLLNNNTSSSNIVSCLLQIYKE